VEVKIGVQFANRELVIDSSMSSDAVSEAVSEALSGKSGVLSLEDTKGRRILVPSEKLAYVELGTPTVGQVGFRS
jgi:predicted small integral membrane protein